MKKAQLKKLKALQTRLKQTPAMYVRCEPDPGSRYDREEWYMTSFTHEQFVGNLREMRKLVDDILLLDEENK